MKRQYLMKLKKHIKVISYVPNRNNSSAAFTHRERISEPEFGFPN
jgi:hypothetical protein